nr:hypothetical protein [Actinomadura bangladeshensis]
MKLLAATVLLAALVPSVPSGPTLRRAVEHANSMPGDVTATVAPPYSATSEFSTVPPRACAITWWP